LSFSLLIGAPPALVLDSRTGGAYHPGYRESSISY